MSKSYDMPSGTLAALLLASFLRAKDTTRSWRWKLKAFDRGIAWSINAVKAGYRPPF